MLKRSRHLYRFSGIIDFGLSLKAQRYKMMMGPSVARGFSHIAANTTLRLERIQAKTGTVCNDCSQPYERALSVEAELKQRGVGITLFSDAEREAIDNPQIRGMVDSLETLVSAAAAVRSAGDPDFSAIVVAGANFVEHAKALELVLENPQTGVLRLDDVAASPFRRKSNLTMCCSSLTKQDRRSYAQHQTSSQRIDGAIQECHGFEGRYLGRTGLCKNK